MINKLKDVISKAKFLTLTLADQGDHVQITATIRPKDGSDQMKPIQVNADWQIAGTLLWNFFRHGYTEIRGAYYRLNPLTVNPVKIERTCRK